MPSRQGLALLTEPAAADGTGAQLLRRLDARLDGHDEAWLKRLLFTHPEVVPLADPDDAVFFPLVPLAREVHTPAGDIDMLFVSPHGHLTVLEAKLGRNAEARREVLAQILDYAREVATWNAGALDARIGRATVPVADGAHAAVAAWGEDPGDAADFGARVTKNLQRGRFQLLIGGDRIQRAAEALVEFLARFAPLPFRLRLLEIEVYGLNDGRRLLVPATGARTVKVERAVVRIAPGGGAGGPPAPGAVEAPGDGTASGAGALGGQAVRFTPEVFFETLARNAGASAVGAARTLLSVGERAEELSVAWGTATASLRLSIPRPDGGQATLTLCYVRAAGTLLVENLGRPLQAAGLPAALAEAFVADTAALAGVEVSPRREEAARWPRWADRADLSAIAPRAAAIAERAARFVSEVLNAARREE